jgi:hypothetical protein
LGHVFDESAFALLLGEYGFLLGCHILRLSNLHRMNYRKAEVKAMKSEGEQNASAVFRACQRPNFEMFILRVHLEFSGIGALGVKGGGTVQDGLGRTCGIIVVGAGELRCDWRVDSWKHATRNSGEFDDIAKIKY